MISVFFSQTLNRNEFLANSLDMFLKQSKILSQAQHWSFQKKSSGKLILASSPALKTKISVSLTHSEKYLAVAFSSHTNVGLDIQVDRTATAGLEERIRSPLDIGLAALELWCIKEATQKVLGLGFQMAMKDIEVQADGNIRLLRQQMYELDFPSEPLNLYWKKISIFPGLHSAIVATDQKVLADVILNQIN